MNVNLDALNLALYDLGWIPQEGINPKMKPWAPSTRTQVTIPYGASEDVEIFVPQDSEAPDFERLIGHAVRELSRFTTADIGELLADATMRLEKRLDKVLIHMETREFYSGIVDLDLGIDLFNGMRDILKTGAKTHVEYRPRYGSAAHTAGENFLRNCYLGQTEAASFIASAYVPVTKKIKLNNDTSNKQAAEASGREITERLVTALEGTREALDEYRVSRADEAIDFAVPNGVSYELLDGIQKIVGTEESEVSFEFLPTDVGEKRTEPKTAAVVFTPEHRQVAEQAKQVLSKPPQPREVSVSGEVIELHRVFDEPDSQRIRLRSNIDGKVRHFVAFLGAEEYEKAQRAHADNVQLNVIGMVLRNRFEDITNVVVTNAPVGGKKTLPQTLQDGLF